MPQHTSPPSLTAAGHSAWLHQAIDRIEADYQRSADTHLIALPLPRFAQAGIDLYLKDESTHPTGSLKHRLARSLFLYALCNGWIGPQSTIVEASSGSTAVSEAYFARLLGLPFVAVMPRSTSPEKIALIEFYGGRCHFVQQAGQVYDAARQIAAETGGHYMDQFTYAERATDWRGNNNIAQSMFTQMQRERHPIPRWIVVGAGTGGTSATVGRYVRYQRYATELCVADPEGSVFADYHRCGDAGLSAPGSRIEGIGRPRVEPSFVRTLVDRMEVVSDAQSIAAMQALSQLLGRRVGPSTGTNFVAMLRLAQHMQAQGEQGSILSLLCDAGERYLPTYYNPQWLAGHIQTCEASARQIQELLV
ncbi:PLP-dependent cysteine synthase family protein [Vandammella animalimorsus]|uniref:L-cysteine desulfhydrase Cds1 n=1 Tax=Vandammella animalimorsus TaxID=2029117 RepID=A0A3M6RKM4_9BURK|nr:PLP-dependent cysteine synthase family protein [Vandammella animalimorsus]RMX15996.1 PLP-dependent cysteine synthase family protein [Vandammella animalimorsus]